MDWKNSDILCDNLKRWFWAKANGIVYQITKYTSTNQVAATYNGIKIINLCKTPSREMSIRVIGLISALLFRFGSKWGFYPHWFLHNCKSIFKSSQIGFSYKVGVNIGSSALFWRPLTWKTEVHCQYPYARKNWVHKQEATREH